MTLNRLHCTFGLAAALFLAETASAQGRFFSRRPIYSSPRTPVYYTPPVIVSSPQPEVTTSDVIGTPTPVVTIGRPTPETTTQWVEVDGYVSPVTSLRTDSGAVSSGPIESPHVVPQFAENYSQRLRVVTSDGQFHNRYYGANGEWIGSNAYGQPEMINRLNADGAQQERRATWGYGEPKATPQPAKRRSSGMTYQQMSNITWGMINRNNQLLSRGGRYYGGGSSSSSGSSSGGSSSSGSYSSGGGGGTQSIIYDDNAPGK